MKKIIIPAAVLFMNLSGYAQGFDIVPGEPLNSNHQTWNVKGRNGILIKQKLSFGKYYTTSVKRSAIRKWTSASGLMHVIWTEHMAGRQTIRFALCNGTDTSDVQMLTNVSSRDLVIGTNPNSVPNTVTSILRIGTEKQQNNLSAVIYPARGEEPWELFLDNTNAELHRKDYIGYVRRGQEYYSVIPVWKLAKKGKIRDMPFGSAGFEIRNDKDETVAATSLMDNGKVYLAPTDEKENFLMASVCAALLLQSNINE
jgi:hypothetical protein